MNTIHWIPVIHILHQWWVQHLDLKRRILFPRQSMAASTQSTSGMFPYQVSLAALNHRVHKLGLISDWKYRDFCIEIARRGYNKSEPRGTERERSVVWQKVLNSLWSEGKTHKTIADEIHVRASEVNDLLFGVLTAATGQTRQDRQPLTLVPRAENE